MGGLEMSGRDALIKGGKSGPAIAPGDPDKSLLIQAVTEAAVETQHVDLARCGKQDLKQHLPLYLFLPRLGRIRGFWFKRDFDRRITRRCATCRLVLGRGSDGILAEARRVHLAVRISARSRAGTGCRTAETRHGYSLPVPSIGATALSTRAMRRSGAKIECPDLWCGRSRRRG